MDNLSQYSFKSSASAQQRNGQKVYIDGEMLDGEYVNKEFAQSSLISIQIPSFIKDKIRGDKCVVVKQLLIKDATIILADRPKILFQLRVKNYRNNFGSSGDQTNIIGVGSYNSNIDKYVLDSQFFELDSIIPLQIQVYYDKRDGNGFVIYQIPNDGQSFIQYDIQTIYNFF